MKVVVLTKFRDKKTGQVRQVGEEFECTKKRFNEILSVGEFVKEIIEEKPEE